MTETPSAFSVAIPKLQRAWDATSFRVLMSCPRAYKYSIIDGWRKSGMDVEFGGHFARAVEVWKKGRLNGLSKENATLPALRDLLNNTWQAEQSQPWSGVYDTEWHCTGTEPYKNAKGNKAKCPWSHKGKWFPSPGPTTCGTCGSETEEEVHWMPQDDYKNRVNLVRLFLWYIEEQPETLGTSGISPIRFPDGTPAVELSFVMPLPWKTPAGEPYLLAGHFDGIGQVGQTENLITDNKTTMKFMGPKYWAQFSPNVQVDIYDLTGSILYSGLNIRGVGIEAAQILKDGAKFGFHVTHRTEAQREELMKELEIWLKQAEQWALSDYWPMNRASCYLCEFKSVCSMDPSMREAYLRSNFVKKHWNPLEER